MKYFTADTHFGHKNIIGMMARISALGALMGSAEEHDQHLLDSINRLVGPDDELIIVGDFSWKQPGKYRTKIICRNVKLVRGNHDKITASTNVFGNLPDTIETEVYNKKRTDSIKLFLSHYPHSYWNQSHRGSGHLYGHCHGQREEYLDELEPQRRALDVGVDNIFRLYGGYRPISEIEVYDYMARRSGHDDIRFYDDYQTKLYIDQGLIRK